MARAAVRSTGVIIMLLLIVYCCFLCLLGLFIAASIVCWDCLLLLPLFVGDVFCPCFVKRILQECSCFIEFIKRVWKRR